MTKEEKSRVGWPPGEWDNEPDDLVFESHRLPCLIYNYVIPKFGGRDG